MTNGMSDLCCKHGVFKGFIPPCHQCELEGEIAELKLFVNAQNSALKAARERIKELESRKDR